MKVIQLILSLFFVAFPAVLFAGEFVNNNDGTITDITTGLMWEQKTDDASFRDRDNTYTWQEAGDTFITGLNAMRFANVTDWRMPTIKELTSLAELSAYNSAINTGFFSNTMPSPYWSSSTDPYRPGSAWCVNFYYGNSYYSYKSDAGYVRAVRGGQSRSLGHLNISTPRQASSWDIGSVIPITWEPGDVPEDQMIIISLSHDGGRTFTEITTQIPNNGYYEWPVTGDSTYNGYLKIEPVSATYKSKATAISFFTIDDYIQTASPSPANLTIPETGTASYRIKLTRAPTADISIRLYSANTDICTVHPASITLNSGNYASGPLVEVSAVDNQMNDGDKTCTIIGEPMESLDIFYDDMVVPDLEITVTDNDPPEVAVTAIQPTTGTVNSALSLTLTGTELDSDVTSVALILENQDGSLDWTHAQTLSQIFQNYHPYGTELIANFNTADKYPDTTGQYTIRLSHNTGFLDIEGAVTIQNPEDLAELEGKKAIIVAGRESAADVLWNAAQNNADRAYETLKFQGYPDNQLQKLSAPAKTSLGTAVTSWASDADELILYMVDHGSGQEFHLDTNESVTATELDNWLDAIQTPRAVRVIVIIDACMSASFVQPLKPVNIHSGSERIVIASAGADEKAWFINSGSLSFSRSFWDTVYTTGRLYRSFINGRDITAFIQNSEADIDEDGLPESIQLADLTNGTLTDIIIGRGAVAASLPPEVITVGGPRTLDCETSATISATEVVFHEPKKNVTAVIIPPQYGDVPPDTVITNLPSVKLIQDTANGPYTGEYNDFTQSGTYQILVYAYDMLDVRSSPKPTRVLRTCGINRRKGDINKDTQANLADAIIVLQTLSGMDVTDLVRDDYVTSTVDVDGLNKVSLEEAIFILREVAFE